MRRCSEADKDYDAVTSGILALGIDVKIGFPIIDGPDVAGLIDNHACLTHHWSETRIGSWSVQRVAVVQQHRAAFGWHRVRVAGEIASPKCFPGGRVAGFAPASFVSQPSVKLLSGCNGPKFATHKLSSLSTVTSHGLSIPPPSKLPMIVPSGRIP